MKAVSNNSFGLLIAYLIPGFAILWGLSYPSSTIRSWLGASQAGGPTVGGFLYVTLASIAAGLTASTVRWLVLDTVHHWTGVPRPRWDFSRLQQNVAAYDLLVEYKYRYAQFYGNALVSLVLVYFARRMSLGFWSVGVGIVELGFLLLSAVFFAGSRDTYLKYILRGNMLLGRAAHAQEGEQKQPSPKPIASQGKEASDSVNQR